MWANWITNYEQYPRRDRPAGTWQQINCGLRGSPEREFREWPKPGGGVTQQQGAATEKLPDNGACRCFIRSTWGPRLPHCPLGQAVKAAAIPRGTLDSRNGWCPRSVQRPGGTGSSLSGITAGTPPLIQPSGSTNNSPFTVNRCKQLKHSQRGEQGIANKERSLGKY